jgi:hypothetical protein
MARNHKRLLLAATIGVLAMSWVGAVSGGMPGMFGQWPGFHASDKGYPGWSEYEQDRGVDTLSVTGELDREPGFGSYQGFEGAQQGQYPGGRPSGR